jgi:hypothetical protein
VAVLHVAEDLGEVGQAFFGQDADVVDQTCDAARCVGSSREAEDEDLVVGDVVAREELVACSYDFCYACVGEDVR